MFKNYLTYTLVQSFHRSCISFQIDQAGQSGETLPTQIAKERLLRSSENLIHHFARSVHTQDSKEECAFLAVSLLALRDCKETLDESKLDPTHEIYGQYTLLHGRMEQLCLKAADKNGGQLRMLG